MTSDRQKDKTMYNKTIYAILFLSAAFCLRAAGQEAPQKNMYDFGFIKDSNPWLSSFNAAGLGTLQVERTSFAEASFDKEDGGVIPVEGSDDSWQAGAQTESFVKISDRIAFHGKLSYSYFSGRNMGGHYLMDPGYNPINFVESTEEDRGTKVKELYGLLGGISYTFNVEEKGITLTAKFGIDYLARAEQAKENLESALGTSVFEWSTLTQAVDAYEAADGVTVPGGGYFVEEQARCL